MIPLDTIIQGDCLEEMKKLPDKSIDAIVTDPPYELAFMGKKWDTSGIAYNVDMWGECLRVLKPGGHLLAFGGARTYHRMACAIEDAGFEIRDSLHWVYGSGFPKSLDIGKAIDRSIFTTKTHNPDFQIVRAWVRGKVKAAGLTYKQIDTALGNANSHKASHYLDNSQPQLPTPEDWEIIKQLLKLDESIDIDRPPKLLVETFEREIIGYRKCHAGLAFTSEGPTELPITKPLSKEAEQWAGYGSALKPAHEPVVLARKLLDGCTIAENVLRWGCGGLNIDATRIPGKWSTWRKEDGSINKGTNGNIYGDYDPTGRTCQEHVLGRFPSNLIHDGSPEVLQLFPQSSITGKRTTQSKSANVQGTAWLTDNHESQEYTDSGSASRFFMSCEFTPADYAPIVYYAKASKSDRGEGNTHNTVKPTSLIRYLCRLITPPGGTILDPFAGSGTTCLAALQEGFHYIGIEKEPEYCEIARKRVAAVPARLDRWAEAGG
jgi:DNA modification methylase